ncbi:DHA2 family efflux MFS transporter permease subunit [Nocardioides sp. Kera G14]|uniref:DHA2 family efflux MFS transporter permease subunit n=1 Tax=Nocardioides sp. Kera G14 TaxID=2884264 RepID=UPI001D120BA7|nr:DHA2 family efflux MFS transporter permease subunit [Nocardioides sp. Kera G14]UDY23368.1 DHA2 family efflux MFS transporter permease subunit [Nocardioides sp. Kera G14]
MTSETTTAATPLDADDKITKDILVIAGVVVLGMIMSILDITVVNVALPTFQTELANGGKEIAYSTVAWTVTGYTLALAMVIPITGWAADRFGTKKLFIGAVTLFTLGSALCATAWSIESLIAFRVLQGLGGGMLMPLGMTIMTKAAGPHRMGKLMAILGVPMLLGPILGPILGGWLIDAASWHWVFLINLPLGVITIVYALFALPRDNANGTETFDFVGFLLMSPGLAAFLYGVSKIPSTGTAASAEVLIPALIGLALIIGFVFWSFRPQHPLLDLRLFHDRQFTVSNIIMFLFAGAFFGALLLVPTYFQTVRGESTLDAGLLVAPQGLGAMLVMPIAGTLADKIPVGKIVPFGFLGIIIGFIGLASSTSPDTPTWHICAWLFVTGLGMGGTMMPIFTAALRTLTQVEVARGSTLLNVIQQIASSVGVAVISVVLTNKLNGSDAIATAPGSPQALSDMGGAFQTSYIVALIVIVATLIPVALLPRKKEEGLNAPQQPTMMH